MNSTVFMIGLTLIFAGFVLYEIYRHRDEIAAEMGVAPSVVSESMFVGVIVAAAFIWMLLL